LWLSACSGYQAVWREALWQLRTIEVQLAVANDRKTEQRFAPNRQQALQADSHKAPKPQCPKARQPTQRLRLKGRKTTAEKPKPLTPLLQLDLE
jgi:hypothetical protein